MGYDEIMIITFYGLSCFKIESQGIVIAINPFSREKKFSTPYFEARIVLATVSSYADSRIAGTPFSISGPGEYEIGGVVIRGVALSEANTAYLLRLEGMTLLHLGEFADKKPFESIAFLLKDAFERADILFVPVGDMLGVDVALAISNDLDARIVIPMHHTKPDQLETFLKAVGHYSREGSSFSVKTKDLLLEGRKVIVLKP